MSILHFLAKKLYCKSQSAIAINIFFKFQSWGGGGGGGGVLTPPPPLPKSATGLVVVQSQRGGGGGGGGSWNFRGRRTLGGPGRILLLVATICVQNNLGMSPFVMDFTRRSVHNV